MTGVLVHFAFVLLTVLLTVAIPALHSLPRGLAPNHRLDPQAMHVKLAFVLVQSVL